MRKSHACLLSSFSSGARPFARAEGRARRTTMGLIRLVALACAALAVAPSAWALVRAYRCAPPCLPACVLCTQGTRRARAPANTLTRVTPCRRPRSRWRSTFSWRHPRWRQPRAPPRAGTRACAACFFFRRRRTLRQRRALAPPGPPGSGVGRLKCAFRARLGRCSNTVVTQTGPGWTTPDSGTPDCLAPRTLPRAPRSAPPCLCAASSPSALGT